MTPYVVRALAQHWSSSVFSLLWPWATHPPMLTYRPLFLVKKNTSNIFIDIQNPSLTNMHLKCRTQSGGHFVRSHQCVKNAHQNRSWYSFAVELHSSNVSFINYINSCIRKASIHFWSCNDITCHFFPGYFPLYITHRVHCALRVQSCDAYTSVNWTTIWSGSGLLLMRYQIHT